MPNDHTVRRALKQLNIHFNQVNQKKMEQNFTLRVVVEFSPALAEEFTA
jgi:predicted amino acid-binding ACT domain protein